MPDWKNLPPLFPRAVLHPAVITAADGRTANEPWCVAFSGGADSLALLLLVWAHWPARREKLVALHFNHCLRGAESDADEAFCRDICGALGVSIRIGTWTKAHPDVSEAEAREARQEFFADEMRSLGASVLWTGHQCDDIAETQLMRLARGSSSAGLAAPRPVQISANGRVVLRPMLTLEKAAVLAALRNANLPWREDASNQTAAFFRNRIRRDVLPAWRSAAENDALSGAALSRELLEEDDAALEVWLASLGVKMSADVIDLRPLAGKPQALWRRALRRWSPASELARAGFEELLAFAMQGAGRVSVGPGVAVGEGGVWKWSSSVADREPWNSVALHEGVALFLPDGAEIRCRVVEVTAVLRTHIFSGAVDPAREAYCTYFNGLFTVRPWMAGDRYRPLGAPGSSKLQDMFINRKVPLERRASLPVICASDGRNIIWVPGFSPADEWKVTDTSVTAVHLTYHAGTSTVTPSPNL